MKPVMLILLVISMSISTSLVFAQTEEEQELIQLFDESFSELLEDTGVGDSDVNIESDNLGMYDAGDFYIWLPTQMLQGLEYEGIIVFDDAAENNLRILTASTESIDIAEYLIVERGRNSLIFTVTPLKVGNAEISFLINDELHPISTTIFYSSLVPSAMMILIPETTASQFMTGYAYIADSSGNPNHRRL